MDQEKAKLRTDIEALAKRIAEKGDAVTVMLSTLSTLSARVAILEGLVEVAKAAKAAEVAKPTLFAKREKK